jgi:hypothetical protein
MALMPTARFHGYVAELPDGSEINVGEWRNEDGERFKFTVAQRPDKYHLWGPAVDLTEAP